MSRQIVGLDPSLSSTGIALGPGLGAHTIITKPGDYATSVVGRAARVTAISRRVSDLTEPGALVVIEAPGFSRGAEPGAHLRAGLWWLLAITLFDRGCEVVEVAPTTLKKFATGRGNADKADMRMALYQRAGLDLRDDNQVDAWWLREAGLHLTGHPNALTLPKPQVAALARLRTQETHP